MIYTLATPVTIGDIGNQIAIDKLELASVSLNFDPAAAALGTAILSIVLIHRASGYKHTITYQDATALAFWTALDTANNVVTKALFAKMIADGKLPAGTLA